MEISNLRDGKSETATSRHDFEKGLQPFITNSLLQRISGQLDELVREARLLRDVLAKSEQGRV